MTRDSGGSRISPADPGQAALSDLRIDAIERTWLGVDVETPQGPGQVVARAPRSDTVWVTNGLTCWEAAIADLVAPGPVQEELG